DRSALGRYRRALLLRRLEQGGAAARISRAGSAANAARHGELPDGEDAGRLIAWGKGKTEGATGAAAAFAMSRSTREGKPEGCRKIRGGEAPATRPPARPPGLDGSALPPARASPGDLIPPCLLRLVEVGIGHLNELRRLGYVGAHVGDTQRDRDVHLLAL